MLFRSLSDNVVTRNRDASQEWWECRPVYQRIGAICTIFIAMITMVLFVISIGKKVDTPESKHGVIIPLIIIMFMGGCSLTTIG